MSQGAAVIYCRVSTAGQEDNTSLETQEQTARAYCASKGYTVAIVKKDVQSGAGIDRPGLRAALEAMRTGVGEVLVVHALDRLSRNQTHQSVLFYQVEQFNARIESATEEIDNGPTGQIVRAVAGVVAELEREKIKERTARGKRARAERGGVIPGSFPSYGYMWTDERHTALVPDEDTAPIVRRMFRAVVEGSTLNGIATLLTAERVPTPSQYRAARGMLAPGRKIGEKWGQSVIHKILQNPAYKGEYTAFRHKREKGRVLMRGANDPARVSLPASACPALIDAATWEAVQRQLERNQLHAYRNARNPELALLSRGFVFCAHCGHAMHTEYHVKRNLAYYGCLGNTLSAPCEYRTRISAKELDAALSARISKLAKHPEAIQRAAEHARQAASEERAEIQERIDTLGKLINRDTAKRRKLLRSLEELDEDTSKELAPRIRELSQHIQRYQTDRDTLQRSLQNGGDTLLLEKGLLWGLENFADAPYDWKRQLLQEVGIAVGVYADGHVPADGLGSWRLVFKWTGLNESALFPQHQGVQHGD